MRLFLEQGFEKTTVEKIAAAAGLSRTSFFRYFASKEDVVLGNIEELGRRVLGALVERPAREPAWQALRHAFDVVIEEAAALPEHGLAQARMLHEAPSLKASRLGKQLSWWQDLLVPEVARRLGARRKQYDPRPRALVAAALACLNTAVEIWTDSNGAVDLQSLLNQAMGALSA
jgi:AcrR family transcriptional regulator